MYVATDIKDEALRFIVHLLVGCVLIKCRPNEVPAIGLELAAQAKDKRSYN